MSVRTDDRIPAVKVPSPLACGHCHLPIAKYDRAMTAAVFRSGLGLVQRYTVATVHLACAAAWAATVEAEVKRV